MNGADGRQPRRNETETTMNAINTATHLFAALASLTGDNWLPCSLIGDYKNEALLTLIDGDDVFTVLVHRGKEDFYVETQINFKDDMAVTNKSLAVAFRKIGYMKGANKI